MQCEDLTSFSKFWWWLIRRSVWNSLFDMDGTLVDSVAGVTAAWEIFAEKYPDKNIDVRDILSSGFSFVERFTFGAYNLWFVASHGVRTADNLRKYCGIEDPDELKVGTIIHLVISGGSNGI